MNNYTIKCNFQTVKIGRGSTISGASLNGEVDLSCEHELTDEHKQEIDLLSYCKSVLQANPKVKGSIIGLQIQEIIELKNDKN